MKKILVCVAFILSLMPLAYAQSTDLITREQAIEIAKHIAISEGANSEKAYRNEIHAEFNEDEGWIVLFSGDLLSNEGHLQAHTILSVVLSKTGERKYIRVCGNYESNFCT